MMSYKNISNFFVKFLKDLGNDLNTDEWQEKIAECLGDGEDSILKRRKCGVQLMHQVLCAAYFKTARIVTNGAGIIGSIQNDIPRNDNTSVSDVEDVKSSPIKKAFKVNPLSKNYVPETMAIDQKILARKESNTDFVPETQSDIIDEIETSLSPSRSPENEIKIEEINSPPSSPILGQKKKSGKQPNRKNSTSLLCNNKKVVNEYALEALYHSKLKPGDPGYYSPESLKRNSEMYPPLPIKIEKHSKTVKDKKQEESPGRQLESAQDKTYEESPSLLAFKRLETKEKVTNIVREKKSNNTGVAEKLLENEEGEEEIVRKTERNKKRFSSSFSDWPNESDFETPQQKQSKIVAKNSPPYPDRPKSPSTLSKKRSRERESNKNKEPFGCSKEVNKQPMSKKIKPPQNAYGMTVEPATDSQIYKTHHMKQGLIAQFLQPNTKNEHYKRHTLEEKEQEDMKKALELSLKTHKQVQKNSLKNANPSDDSSNDSFNDFVIENDENNSLNTRKKSDRAKLPAGFCKECEDYKKQAGLSTEQFADIWQKCSRHRALNQIPDGDSPKNWQDTSFAPDGPENKTQYSKTPLRTRLSRKKR